MIFFKLTVTAVCFCMTENLYTTVYFYIQICTNTGCLERSVRLRKVLPTSASQIIILIQNFRSYVDEHLLILGVYMFNIVTQIKYPPKHQPCCEKSTFCKIDCTNWLTWKWRSLCCLTLQGSLMLGHHWFNVSCWLVYPVNRELDGDQVMCLVYI